MEDKNRRTRTFIVRVSKTQQVHRPPGDGPEREEMDRKSLQHTVAYIQNCGRKKGMDITTDEIAEKLGITSQALEGYLSGEERVPGDLRLRLRGAYEPLLKIVELQRNREWLQHTVVLLRNHGLAKGMNITLEEMAGSLSLTKKEFVALLRGESEVAEDLVSRLNRAWDTLLEDVERVEIVEDFDTIMDS